MRGIEAAVDATFTKQKHPVFRKGSAKWTGIRKWGFYIDLFYQISSGEQASLAMSPREWMRCWEEHPRLMAILKVVQGHVRGHMAEETERAKAEAKKHGTMRKPSRR